MIYFLLNRTKTANIKHGKNLPKSPSNSDFYTLASILQNYSSLIEKSFKRANSKIKR